MHGVGGEIVLRAFERGVDPHLADETRVIVRPSGTEPKVMIYLEAIVHANGSLADTRAEAARRLARTRDDEGQPLTAGVATLRLLVTVLFL